MKLFINDEPKADTVDENDLERALDEFEKKAVTAVAIGSILAGFCRVHWDEPGSCMLDIFKNGALMGVRLPERELRQARATFQEFLRGYAPQLPVKHLKDLAAESVVIGDPFEDDCPLCRLGK